MKPRLDGLPRVAGVGGAGAIWGLGLARLMAEAGFWPLLYGSPLAVVGVAIACAGVALALWQRPLLPYSPAPLLLALLYVTGILSTPLAGGVLLVGGAALTLLALWGNRARWAVPAALGLTTFALYLRTLLPSLGQADTFEFQVIVPRLGVAHPTGYPLYVLLGKLFTFLPLNSIAWRVNLASAVFATSAVLVVYFILLRLTSLCQTWPQNCSEGIAKSPLLAWIWRSRPSKFEFAENQGTARWLPPFLAALAFAFSATFWSQAIVAEIYTLHNLFVAAIFWLLLSPRGESPPTSPPGGGTEGGGRGEATRRWQAIFLLIGLGLANHLTTALLLPAVALALLWDRPRLKLRDWLIAGGLALLGLSVYLFIPLRWPALNHGQWMTLREFAAYVTGGQFHGALRLEGWRDPTRWAIVGRLLQQPFGWVGLGLAATGVVEWAVRQRRALALTGVTFLAFAFYGLSYHVPDVSVFILPAHLILALWIGAGVGKFASMQVCKFASSQLGGFVSLVIGLLAIVYSQSLIWTNLPLVDQSRNQGNYAWGQYVLGLPLVESSAVLADVEKFAPLYYLQQIEGARPDLDLILLGSEELYQAELAARLETEQTIYLARYLPRLEGLRLRSVGPLVEVSKSASLQVAKSASLQVCRSSPAYPVNFGDEIGLLCAQVSADPLGRPLYHLTLYWQAETEARGDFVVRLRLVDDAGRARWESDGARPVNSLYPTNAWPVGATISDYHEISPPPWLPRGDYQLQVGLFPPFSDTGLAVGGGATSWLPLGALTVDPPSDPPPLPRESRYLFAGGAWLTGFDLADETLVGTPFVADLAWRGVEKEGEIRLTWVDARGQEVGSSIFSLAAGAPRSRHTIAAPQTPGSYTLRVGLTGETARCNWLSPPASDCPLATIEAAPAQEGLANFAGQTLLLEAAIGQPAAQPGETIPVTLQWRALRTMDEDYTAFVHLVGPDGRLHGQVDAWPVQGSYPTTQWTPGEQVHDSYQVRLAPDAPSGRYRVEVGWYLLATMQRLQTVDADGQPIGDSFVVGEFDVSD